MDVLSMILLKQLCPTDDCPSDAWVREFVQNILKGYDITPAQFEEYLSNAELSRFYR
jgi:hypothetical protein